MDSLHIRYASPFIYLDLLILHGKLSEFIDEFYEQLNEDSLWELYLHREIESSFKDWKDSIVNEMKLAGKEPTKREIEATIQYAEDILNGFVPD